MEPLKSSKCLSKTAKLTHNSHWADCVRKRNPERPPRWRRPLRIESLLLLTASFVRTNRCQEERRMRRKQSATCFHMWETDTERRGRSGSTYCNLWGGGGGGGGANTRNVSLCLHALHIVAPGFRNRSRALSTPHLLALALLALRSDQITPSIYGLVVIEALSSILSLKRKYPIHS